MKYKICVTVFETSSLNLSICLVEKCCASAGNAESKGYSQYAETVASCLNDAGLAHALLSDLDVTAERLQGRKLVILP